MSAGNTKSKAKRDIDKELMYSKIMPSAPRPGKAAVQDGRIAEAINEKAQEIIATGASQIHNHVGKTNIYPKNTIAMPTPRPKILVNLVEYAIKDKLDEAFAKFNCCKCDKCKMDVVAITLNKMEPKYVVISEEDIPTAMKKYTGNVVPSIVKAIIEVKSNPRH